MALRPPLPLPSVSRSVRLRSPRSPLRFSKAEPVRAGCCLLQECDPAGTLPCCSAADRYAYRANQIRSLARCDSERLLRHPLRRRFRRNSEGGKLESHCDHCAWHLHTGGMDHSPQPLTLGRTMFHCEAHCARTHDLLERLLRKTSSETDATP